MLLRQRIEQAFAAVWAVSLEDADRVLPRGAAPLDVDGKGLLSLVVTRFGRGTAGPLPIPGYTQLELVVHGRSKKHGHEGPYPLMTRVTPGGASCVLRRVKYRPTVVRFAPGRVEMPGGRVSVRFEPAPSGAALPVEPAFGHEPVVLVMAKETRGYRRTVTGLEWSPVRLVGQPALDPVLALGFDVGEPTWALLGGPGEVEARLPTRRLAALAG
ncbi:MAG: hypothetical protein R3C15_02820 [Thermoleophilia bacterium]